MRRSLVFALAFASFASLPILTHAKPLVASLVFVLFGVLLANAISGGFSATATAGGAIGALLGGILFPGYTLASGGLFLTFVYGERLGRVEKVPVRLAAGVSTFMTGAIGTTIVERFGYGERTTFVVAAMVAAVLATLPLLFDAVSPLAHRLAQASRRLSGDVAEALREASILYSDIEDLPLDKEMARGVSKTWASLEKLVDARLSLVQSGTREGTTAGAIAARLDANVKEHVDVLRRAITASCGLRAAHAGLDDVALRGVESAGKTLEEVGQAVLDTK